MRVGILNLRYIAILSSCDSPLKYLDQQSPLSLSPPSDFRFSSPLSDHILDISFPRVQDNGVQEKDAFPRYSSMFRMGLFLTVRERSFGLSFVNLFFADSERRDMSIARCKTWGSSFARLKRLDEARKGHMLLNVEPSFQV
jgi:hypothetical protein